jgi:hypothetical protein
MYLTLDEYEVLMEYQDMGGACPNLTFPLFTVTCINNCLLL